MRIFLDVGGHYGETLEVALEPRWGFERVVSFEPSSAALRVLRGYRDPRLTIVAAGLSGRSGPQALYGAGLLGGSVYAEKDGSGGFVETIELVRASDWIREHTAADDELFLKLNCEGSEADILDDLLDSDVLSRLCSVYVDFDIRKIPTQAHRQADIERRLRDAVIEFVTHEQLGTGGRTAVKAWLEDANPATAPAGNRLRFALKLHRPPYIWASRIAEHILPGWLFQRLARRLGASSRR